MKYIVQINTRLMNSIVEEIKFSNAIPFSRNILVASTLESDLAVNFIKNIIYNNNTEDKYTLNNKHHSYLFILF